MTTRLYLVDATYELFRAYYAKWTPSRTSAEGVEVGAVYALLSSMVALIRDAPLTHIACATDHTVTSFRNHLFDGYKDGEGLDPVLLNQFEFAETALAAMGLTVWAMTEFEADDAIASAVHRFSGAVDEIVICSPDKDFAQLVDENGKVVLFDRRREKRYNADAVREKWGVSPRSIPDYLALVGDAADGIPGLQGFGAKTTAKLLQTYLHIEDIPADPTAWTCKIRGSKGLAERLQASQQDVRLYKQLATLRTDAPITPDLAGLAFTAVPEAPWRAFCTRHGFSSFADRALQLRRDDS